MLNKILNTVLRKLADMDAMRGQQISLTAMGSKTMSVSVEDEKKNREPGPPEPGKRCKSIKWFNQSSFRASDDPIREFFFSPL